MPSLPGLDADVFFGDSEKPLPDWRQRVVEESDDPEDSLTDDDLAAVKSMLGFDPDELVKKEAESPEDRFRRARSGRSR